MNTGEQPAIDISVAAADADWEAVRNLFVGYFESLDAQVCKPALEREISALPGVFGEAGGAVLVAWLDAGEARHAIGCCAYRPGPEPGAAEMCRLYVSGNYRRGGLGRALAEAVQASAATEGYRHMVLHTLSHWDAALALYRSMGFGPGKAYGDVQGPDVVFLSAPLGTAPEQQATAGA